MSGQWVETEGGRRIRAQRDGDDVVLFVEDKVHGEAFDALLTRDDALVLAWQLAQAAVATLTEEG